MNNNAKTNNRFNINDIIVKTALKYVGQEEIKGNQGFKDPEFERKMEVVGFDAGEAWCDLFAELVWKEAYQQYDANYYGLLDLLFTQVAVSTFSKFKKHSKFETGVEPSIGAMAVWQRYKEGKGTWMGHISPAVVDINMDRTVMQTVEGNTNKEGAREGTHVLIKDRPIDFTVKENGLVLIGFIYPNA